MPNEYVYNTVVRSEPQQGKKIPPLYLTIERDPRPRCSMILGDGFSQSFLMAQNLQNEIRWSLQNHFPPPESVMYAPVIGDQFQLSPLWDRPKWPHLYDHWERSGQLQGRDFYLSLPKEIINPHRSIDRLTYDTASIAFELRCYLWHLFRSHHYVLDSETCRSKIDLGRWEWTRLLMLFLSEFALGVITFNYDLVTEMVLMRGFNLLICHYELRDFKQRPANSIAMYKLHGSISYYVNTGMRVFSGKDPNPWLRDNYFGMNEVSRPKLTLDVDMKEFPEFPDLVPPGHYGEDKIAPISHSKSYSKSHINESALVVFCGLSADEPDTAEVKELVDAIDPTATVIQVGLDCDRDNPLSRLLSSRGTRRHFLLPSELANSLDLIKDNFRLYNDWSALFS